MQEHSRVPICYAGSPLASVSSLVTSLGNPKPLLCVLKQKLWVQFSLCVCINLVHFLNELLKIRSALCDIVVL
uniref:Uncharacterized protein n=1 Tax=Arundo donax TaxID=35708 RepID=A0A0A9G9D8_ARUDO